MVNRHLTNTEFELLIDGKPDQLSTDCLAHAESCHQCRQELVELAPLFHWPSSAKSNLSTQVLTEQVFTQLSRQKRTVWAKRMVLICGSALSVVLLFSMISFFWEYLPIEIRTTTAGLFPVMEWLGSFNKAFSESGWFSLSALYLLLGGLFVFFVIMLADSVVISRLLRRMKAARRSVAVAQEQTAQGNRT